MKNHLQHFYTYMFGLLCLLAGVSALFEDNPYVQSIDIAEWKQHAENPDFATALLVYDPQATPSQALAQVIPELASKYHNLMRFFAYDCSVCSEEVKQTLPSFTLQVPAGLNPYTSKPLVHERGFEGDIKDLDKFLAKNIPYLGEEVTSENEQDILQDQQNKVFLFTSKETVPLMYRGLSSYFRGRLLLGVVFSNQTQLVSKYSVEQFPTIIVVTKDQKLTYTGNIKFEELVEFLDPFAETEKRPLKPKRKPKKEQPQASNAQNLEFKVHKVTSGTLNSVLEKEPKLAVVHFYKDKPLPEWEDIVQNYNGMLLLATMECQQDSEVDFAKQLGVKKLPSLRVFPINRKKKSYELSFDSKQELEQELSRDFKADILSLKDSTLQNFIRSVKEEGRIACMLITDSEIHFSFKALASDPAFRDFVKFAHYSTTKEGAQATFRVNLFPTMICFQPTSDQGDLSIIEYPGELGNYKFMYYLLDQMALPKFMNVSPKVTEEDLEEIQEFKAKNFNNECVRQGGICVLGFFEGEPSKKNPEHYTTLKKVKAVMHKKNLPFHFGWVDGVCEFELREKFGISETALPNIAVYAPQKKIGGRLIGTYNEEDIYSFLEQTLRGKTPVFDAGEVEFHNRDCEEVHRVLQETSQESLTELEEPEEPPSKKQRKKRKKKAKKEDL